MSWASGHSQILPQSILNPGEHLIVFASGQATDDYVDPAGFLHTNFRLSASGEYAGLTDPFENVVHDYGPEYPPQQSDVSYGILPDDLSAGEFYFAKSNSG